MIRERREREQNIKDAAEASDIQVEIKFKRQKYTCKQITVDEKNLIYRINNTRVGEDLEVLKATEDKTDEHFSIDREENSETQEILHKTLEKYITTLGKTYQREGELDPLWIDPKGRVLNGNRRLRFYRGISKDDITCILLNHPFLLEEGRDLEIEAEQDAQIEDKERYKWTSWGLNFKKLIDMGQSLEEIGNDRSMHKNEVENHIIGYLGLKDWLDKSGIPGRFDLVPDQIEQIWLTDYPKAYKRAKNDESGKDMVLFLAGLISIVPDRIVGTRRYKPYSDLVSAKNKDNLVKNLKINLSDAFVTESGEFGEIEKFSLDTAVDKIKNNEGSPDVDLAATIYENIETTKANLDDQTADAVQKRIILKSIGQMNSLLETTLPHLNNHDDLEIEGAEEQLKAVEEKITKLKNYIKDHS